MRRFLINVTVVLVTALAGTPGVASGQRWRWPPEKPAPPAQDLLPADQRQKLLPPPPPVRLVPQPRSVRIGSFVADRYSLLLDVPTATVVLGGQPVTLRWDVDSFPPPTSVTLSGPGVGTKAVEAFGQLTVDLAGVKAFGVGYSAPPLTFTLTATGRGGPQTASVQIYTNPSPPQILSFSGTPSGANGVVTIQAGNAATLNWQVLSSSNVKTIVSLSGSTENYTNLPVNGSFSVRPSKTDVYELWARNEGFPGADRLTLLVVVQPTPAPPAPPPPTVYPFYFMATNNQSWGLPCVTLVVYAPDLATATTLAQNMYQNYTITQITAQQYLDGCSQTGPRKKPNAPRQR
jgi:hypothetical protein